MFNLITRLTKTTWRPQYFANSYHTSLHLLSSFTVRDVLHETSDETGTLFARFAKHIAIERYNFDPLVPVSVRYSDFFPVHNMHTFSAEAKRVPSEQLPPLIIFASTYRSNGDPTKFAQVLNQLDAICLKKLPEMNYDTLLNTLYALVFLEPGKLTRMDFYANAMYKLASDFSSEFPKEKFVQACFYFGLHKKQGSSDLAKTFKEFIVQHVDRYVDQYSTLDLAIICNSLYKTSTPVQSDSFKQRVGQETLSITSDDSLLITFLKELRFERVRSEKICKQLAEKWLQTDAIHKLQFTSLAHIYAFLAENSWDDERCLKKLVNEFLKSLSAAGKRFQSQERNLRAKDLCTMLWASAQLNYKFSDAELQQLELVMLQKYNNGDFDNFPEQLTDGCLSLWTLGKQSRQLLQTVLQNKLGNSRKSKGQFRSTEKIDSRLTVLESAASIEQPTWLPEQHCFDEAAPVPQYLLKQRPYFKEYQQRVLQESDVASADIVCPIKGINIPSVFVQLKENAEPQKIFVELAGPEQLTKFGGKPMGILRLKMNLLTSLGYKVQLLSLESLNNEYTTLNKALNSEHVSKPSKIAAAVEPQMKTADTSAQSGQEPLSQNREEVTPQSDEKVAIQSSDNIPLQSQDKLSPLCNEEAPPLMREEAFKNV